MNCNEGGQPGWKMSCHLANLKTNQQRFDRTYMPVFRSYNTDGQNRLWDMPYYTIINTINIGKVLSDMRTGNTTVPLEHLAELNTMGYHNGRPHQDLMTLWEFDYVPVFRTYNNDGQNRLWDMPYNTIINTINIGTVLSCMRTGTTNIPVKHLAELNTMGYHNGRPHQELMWEIDYPGSITCLLFVHTIMTKITDCGTRLKTPPSTILRLVGCNC